MHTTPWRAAPSASASAVATSNDEANDTSTKVRVATARPPAAPQASSSTPTARRPGTNIPQSTNTPGATARRQLAQSKGSNAATGRVSVPNELASGSAENLLTTSMPETQAQSLLVGPSGASSRGHRDHCQHSEAPSPAPTTRTIQHSAPRTSTAATARKATAPSLQRDAQSAAGRRPSQQSSTAAAGSTATARATHTTRVGSVGRLDQVAAPSPQASSPPQGPSRSSRTATNGTTSSKDSGKPPAPPSSLQRKLTLPSSASARGLSSKTQNPTRQTPKSKIPVKSPSGSTRSLHLSQTSLEISPSFASSSEGPQSQHPPSSTQQ